MEIREVYSLQEDAIIPFYFDCVQPIPIFPKHSQARECFENLLMKNDSKDKIIGIYNKNELQSLFLGTIKDETLVIISSLVRKKQSNCLLDIKKWHSWVRNIVRWYNLEKFSYSSSLRNWVIEDYLAGESGVLSFNPTSFSYEELVASRLGIALGGGGAHGAYQIGVWHALSKLGIDYQVVAGTSVGALNAAFMMQGDYDRADKVWSNLTTSDVLEVKQTDVTKKQMNNYVRQMGQLTKEAISSFGISTKPLMEMIRNNVNSKKIITSTKDFYIVTVEIPKLNEKVIKVNKKYKNSLKEWLLASASFFPMMSAAKIEKKYYVDGGYRNNIPIDVALKANTTHVFAIDVKGPGFSKKYSNPDDKYVFIQKSPWNLGPMLLFDPKRADWNMKLGYLETLKYYRMLEGYYYSFVIKESISLKKQLNDDFYQYLSTGDWKTGINFFKPTSSGVQLRKNLSKEYKGRVEIDSISLVVMELLGKKLRISPVELYDLGAFYKIVRRKLIEKVSANSFEEKGLSLDEYIEQFMQKKIQQSIDLDVILQLRELITANSSAKEKVIKFFSNHYSNVLIQLYMISFIIDKYSEE